MEMSEASKHAESEKRRKEHVQKVLADKNADVGKGKLDNDFLCSVKYHNTLPYPPIGPYFENFGILHPFEEFANYRVSSLERNFVWQPHFDTDMNLMLDIVDQEAMLAPECNSKDSKDMDYLTSNVSTQLNDKVRPNVAGDAWWLRNTNYLDKNLFNLTNKRHNPVVSKEATEVNQSEIHDVCSKAGIEHSFAVVQTTVQQLTRSRPALHMVWCVPVFASDISSLSIVQYDEHPLHSVSSLGEDKRLSDNDEGRRVRMRASVLSNVRHSAAEPSALVQADQLHCSLAAPAAVVAETDKEAVQVQEEQVQEQENEENLAWVKDFSIKINAAQAQELFLLTINDKAAAGVAVSYVPLHSRMALHKLSSSAPDNSPTDLLLHYSSSSAAVAVHS